MLNTLIICEESVLEFILHRTFDCLICDGITKLLPEDFGVYILDSQIYHTPQLHELDC